MLAFVLEVSRTNKQMFLEKQKMSITVIFSGAPMVIDEQGCDMVVVNVNKCAGYCPSFSFKNPLKQNELYTHNKCCRMLDVVSFRGTVSK
jgi:hypothetical protein